MCDSVVSVNAMLEKKVPVPTGNQTLVIQPVA